MMDSEDTEDYEFLLEMQQLHSQMEVLIERYDMRDRVMSVVVTGVLEPIDEDTSQMKALFSYNLGSKEEMEEMVSFIANTYKDQNGPDLDELLGGLDISLN
jgi:hypothetical protein|tara:strand:+ start:272 stop:574 length:303 start_codon:yes stop_codon:yes gene_type:complete